jgi:hypothetical protein
VKQCAKACNWACSPIRDELRAVKWRDWKMHLIWEAEPNDGVKYLETPWIFNLITDPKEETNIATEADGLTANQLAQLVDTTGRCSC